MATISEDPKVFGPIFWKSIHSKARNAQSLEQQRQFMAYFKKKLESIPCVTCRSRALEYLQLNPIENAPPAKGPFGAEATMFRYTWEFHNVVNSHLEKPQMSWEEACRTNPITGHLELSNPLPAHVTPPVVSPSTPSNGCNCQNKPTKKKVRSSSSKPPKVKSKSKVKYYYI
jgi:hypothetical protein